jgi:hypothetical protein
VFPRITCIPVAFAHALVTHEDFRFPLGGDVPPQRSLIKLVNSLPGHTSSETFRYTPAPGPINHGCPPTHYAGYQSQAHVIFESSSTTSYNVAAKFHADNCFGFDEGGSPNDYQLGGLMETNSSMLAFQSQTYQDPNCNEFLHFHISDFIHPDQLNVGYGAPAGIDSSTDNVTPPSQGIQPPPAPMMNTNVVQQLVQCSYTRCAKTFTRESDRRRHENTVPGSQTYFCPIVGCRKNRRAGYFQGYCRAD